MADKAVVAALVKDTTSSSIIYYFQSDSVKFALALVQNAQQVIFKLLFLLQLVHCC